MLKTNIALRVKKKKGTKIGRVGWIEGIGKFYLFDAATLQILNNIIIFHSVCVYKTVKQLQSSLRSIARVEGR